MRFFWDERQRRHVPSGEFFNGGMLEAKILAEGPESVVAFIMMPRP